MVYRNIEKILQLQIETESFYRVFGESIDGLYLKVWKKRWKPFMHAAPRETYLGVSLGWLIHSCRGMELKNWTLPYFAACSTFSESVE